MEYDGEQPLDDAEQWLTDIERREELDRRRWRLVVVTEDGVHTDPLRTLVRVRDALRECGHVGLRGSFTAEWRSTSLVELPHSPSHDGQRGRILRRETR